MQVSVITTLFNYADYIKHAIKSFVRQSVPSEMIIVDDCSTDNPYKRIKPYLGDRVKYIKLDVNSGYSHAKNVGIRNARAERLVMLDADDFLTDNSLAIRMKQLDMGYDFVHGPVLHLTHKGTSVSKLWRQWLESRKDYTAYKYVHAQGVMLRKELHHKLGLYDEKLRYKSDREMWARIFNHGSRISTVDQPVAVYRVHERQMSRSKAKLAINDQLQKNVLAIIERRKTDLTGLQFLENA